MKSGEGILTNITDYVLNKTNLLKKVPEISPNSEGFHMFNSGSVEVEVAEFLFALTKIIKPDLIVETGTHYGISALYMGLACDENKKGHVISYEVNPGYTSRAIQLWSEVGVKRIECRLQDSRTVNFAESYGPDKTIDLLFLDSKPEIRFNEYVKFFPIVTPGGFIIIHDLHPHLGHTGHTINGIYDWPYGDFRKTIGKSIKNHEVQTISFPACPRGLTLFQKARTDFGHTNYLLGKEI